MRRLQHARVVLMMLLVTIGFGSPSTLRMRPI
jgi:hypothetical protein